jgi:hypothetical protein
MTPEENEVLNESHKQLIYIYKSYLKKSNNYGPNNDNTAPQRSQESNNI